MVGPRVLSSERFWLRGLCAQDGPFVFRLIADARVRWFLGGVVAREVRTEVFARYCAMERGSGLVGGTEGV